MENPIKMDDLGVPLFSETSICSTFFHISSALWWLQFFTQDDSQAHCSSSGEASKWRRCAAIPSLIGIRDLHASISISGTNIGTESQWGFNWFSIVFKSFCNSAWCFAQLCFVFYCCSLMNLAHVPEFTNYKYHRYDRTELSLSKTISWFATSPFRSFR